ncbi:MAG: PKD domain-containing protein [Proteobacteria bacterium]|nr:PKD domain-containing protein [Pseudomonadota bacterium]MBU0968284.1 PKD domain-containing protein [Pseudomonadota bacterium]
MKKRYLTMLAAGLLVMGGALSARAEVVIIPFLSGLQSQDTDLVVEFNASRAACYEKTFPQPTCSNPLPDTSDPDPLNHIAGGCSDDGAACFLDDDCYDPNIKQTITDLACTYSWDFGDGGAGMVVGGNTATDMVVYEYAAPGTYDVTLTMTDPVSGLSESNTIAVTAVMVETPGNTASFSTVVTNAVCVANRCVGGASDGYKCADDAGCPGGDVMLTFDTAPADLARAYIYWGDRKRTVLVNPAASDSASHTYGRDKMFQIRITTVDLAHDQLDYTSADDPSLSVTP